MLISVIFWRIKTLLVIDHRLLVVSAECYDKAFSWPPLPSRTCCLFNLALNSNLATINPIRTPTKCKSDNPPASAVPCVERMCMCARPPAAEASCSGVSAVLSWPLRAAAPSTLAPASKRSCGDTHHHICYIKQCLTSCNLFTFMTSDLTFVNPLSIASTVGSRQCNRGYCTYVVTGHFPPRIKLRHTGQMSKEEFPNKLNIWMGLNVCVFPTCTTEMCPCSTAKVRAAQRRLSGCTEGCFGEHGGTCRHKTNQCYAPRPYSREKGICRSKYNVVHIK